MSKSRVSAWLDDGQTADDNGFYYCAEHSYEQNEPCPEGHTRRETATLDELMVAVRELGSHGPVFSGLRMHPKTYAALERYIRDCADALPAFAVHLTMDEWLPVGLILPVDHEGKPILKPKPAAPPLAHFLREHVDVAERKELVSPAIGPTVRARETAAPSSSVAEPDRLRSVIETTRREIAEACIDAILAQARTWDRGHDVHAELLAAADRIRSLRFTSPAKEKP